VMMLLARGAWRCVMPAMRFGPSVRLARGMRARRFWFSEGARGKVST